MKKLLILSLFVSFGAFAQEITRKFDVKNFDKLNIGSAFTITVTQGNSYKVEVRGREQDVEDIIAKVSGGELDLGYPNNWSKWRNRKNVYVTITMPELIAANFSGATTSKVSGFKSDNLILNVSGASSSVVYADAQNLKVDCSGASDLKLVGKGSAIEIECSGASDFEGFEFTSQNANIDASGASDVKLFASGKITADASGASSIYCKGGGSMKARTSGASSAKMMK
ncbi:MAG: DUF2807 domain-containing protein [Spirosomaceae bacterium]|jgi:hypothetical protein|nr:DUF2807 domain-containing protein [Spirosomataceae bacterium]